MRVLGIDCGSTATGVGVIESDGRGYQVLHYGAICPARSRPRMTILPRGAERPGGASCFEAASYSAWTGKSATLRKPMC